MASTMRPRLARCWDMGHDTMWSGRLDRNSRPKPNLMALRTQESVIVSADSSAKRLNQSPMGGMEGSFLFAELVIASSAKGLHLGSDLTASVLKWLLLLLAKLSLQVRSLLG